MTIDLFCRRLVRVQNGVVRSDPIMFMIDFFLSWVEWLNHVNDKIN